MSATLNPLAITAAPLLRAIQDAPDAKAKDLAHAAGRHPNHLSRDLKALEAAGLITTEPRGLTGAGREQLAMIGRAEHGGEKRRARGHQPLDKVKPNPKNRPVDPAGIPGLADTIEDKGVLQPALLTPPDAHGVRMILAGERRWRALCHLRAEGRAETLVEQGLPFIEREADEATARLITLIENGQREGLSPWEEALQLKALKDETGWSAREIAKKTGRSPEGSERGVRDVQIKIKVAEEATDQARAQYEHYVAAGRKDAWQQLKDSLQPAKPPAPANPRMALMIAEAALASERLHGVWDGPVPLPPTVTWIAAENEWWTFDGFGTFTLKTPAMNWLAAEDLAENEDRLMMRLQSAAGAPHVLPGVYADEAAAPEPAAETLADMRQAHGAENGSETGTGIALAADGDPERIARQESVYTLPHPRLPAGAPLLKIEIGRHSDGSWTFATGCQETNGGSGYALSFVGAQRRAMPSRQHALNAAINELRGHAVTADDAKRRIAWLDGVLSGAIGPDAQAAAVDTPEARSPANGARGKSPEPVSEAAARALAELARWEREAPITNRREGCVLVDRKTAWSSPEFRMLREAALIRTLDDGLFTYGAVRPSGREWLATKGTGYVAAVHNSEVWKTPWIAKVAEFQKDDDGRESIAEKNDAAPGFVPAEDQTVRLVTMIEALCDALEETRDLVARCEPADPVLIEEADDLFDRHDSLLTTIEDRLAAETLPARCCRAQEGQGEIAPDAVKGEGPAVPVRRSITADHIVCLEDGRRFVGGLKRHLRTAHNLSPEDYRAKWGLPADYPMLAPNFAWTIDARRRALGIEQ